jgi:excisionase family DNA binding protein
VNNKLDKLLSAQQVAEFLGIHPKTLYKALRENRIALNFVRLQGRTIAFRPKDVEAYVESREVNRTGDGIRKRRKMTFIEQMKRKYPGLRTMMTQEEAVDFFKGVKLNRTEEEWYQLGAQWDTPD